MTEPKNELTVWTPAPFSGSDLLPVTAEPADTTGRENVEASDLILPTIKLLQGMSPECSDPDYPDARPGKFFHTGMGAVIEAPIRTIFVAHTKSRALFPKENNPAFTGVSKCLARNGLVGDHYGVCATCPHKEWRPDNKPPLCSEAHNFIALTPFGTAIMRFARTSYRAAQRFLTAWTTSPKPVFAHPVQVSVKPEPKIVDGKQVTFFRMEPKWLFREDVPPAYRDAAKAVYEQVTKAHDEGRLAAADEQEQFTDDIPL